MKTTHSQRSSSSVLLGCLTVRSQIIEAYLCGDMRMPTFRLGKGFVIRQRSSTSLATTPSLLRGSTIAPITNPGTQFAMADEPIRLDDGSYSMENRYLIRLFWSFGQCIEGFRHCRPVLCVDGTFLSGKYHGTLLTALSADATNKILPIAFAYVESENNDTWLWFLTLIKTRVVGHRQRVCVISDRHAGISSCIGYPS